MKNFYIVKGFVECGALKHKAVADEISKTDLMNRYRIMHEDLGTEVYIDIEQEMDPDNCPIVQYAIDLVYRNGNRWVDLVVVATSEEEAEDIATKLSDKREI